MKLWLAAVLLVAVVAAVLFATCAEPVADGARSSSRSQTAGGVRATSRAARPVTGAAAVPVAAAESEPAAPPRRVAAIARGLVRDTAGRPIAGAEVKLLASVRLDARGEVLASVRTGPDGRFRLPCFALGVDVFIQAAADGMAAMRQPAQIGMDYEFVLHPGGGIIGRVLDDATGAPVPGAVLVGGADPGLELTVSDADGAYALRHLPPRSGWISVRAAGFDPMGFRMTASPGSVVRQDVRLLRGPDLTGKITIAGRAAAGARVTARAAAGSPLAETTTGADGTYFLRSAASALSLRIACRGQQARSVSVMPVWNGDRTASMDVDLSDEPAALLRGRVLSGGVPVPDARVGWTWYSLDRGIYGESAVTGADGRFELPAAPSLGRSDGYVPLGIEGPVGFAPFTKHKAVRPPGATAWDSDFEIPAAARIRGRFRWDDGEPCPGVAVVLGDRTNGNIPQDAAVPRSGSDGRFEAAVEPGGDLLWYGRNYGSWKRREIVRVEAGADADFGDIDIPRGASLAGSIADASGRALVGAGVSAWRGNEFLGMATSGGDGRWEIDGLPSVELKVQANTHDNGGMERLGVTPGGAPVDLVLPLARAPLLRGFVRDAEDRPVRAFRVTVYRASTAASDDPLRTLDDAWFQSEDGSFAILTWASKEPVAVTVDTPLGTSGRLGPVEIREGAPSEPLRVVVAPAGTLRVHVEGPYGGDATSAIVVATPEDGRPGCAQWTWNKGTADFGRMRPGPYLVVATTRDGGRTNQETARAETRVVVKERAATEAELRLVPTPR